MKEDAPGAVLKRERVRDFILELVESQRPGDADPLRARPLCPAGCVPPDPARGGRRTRRRGTPGAGTRPRHVRGAREDHPGTRLRPADHDGAPGLRGLVEPPPGVHHLRGRRPRGPQTAYLTRRRDRVRGTAAPGRRRPDGHRASAHQGRSGPHPVRRGTGDRRPVRAPARTARRVRPGGRPGDRADRRHPGRGRTARRARAVPGAPLRAAHLGHHGTARRVRPLDLPRRPLPHRLPAHPRPLGHRAAGPARTPPRHPAGRLRTPRHDRVLHAGDIQSAP